MQISIYLLLFLFTIWALGVLYAFVGLKSALIDNGNEDWTSGKQMFTFLISFSSWAGYFATTETFINWAENSKIGKQILK